MKLDRQTITRSREMRAHATDHERRLWHRLRELNRHGWHFRRQVPFRGYYLDFVEHQAKLVIELDGEQHGTATNSLRDAKRDAVIEREGYTVLRFWNHELNEDLERVVECIARELRKRRPHPKNASHFSTSPQGGGSK
jgi:very-short-patch-repair endonuclease